jgi:hypothetical protein
MWIVFPPYEVAAAREELRRFLDEDQSLNLGRQDVEAIMRQCFRWNPDLFVDAIRIERQALDHVVLMALAGALRFHLERGKYHVYRGILNRVGDGVYRTWRLAIARMVEKGYLNMEAANEARTGLASEIKSIG